jgi:Protein of unknown function (DUF1569)
MRAPRRAGRMKTLAREQDKAEIVRRLRTVRPDSARRWGRMTAPQMICHLCDACRMATGQKVVSDTTLPLPRTLVKWLALYTPLRWRTGILTRPEIDQQVAGTKPGDFAADVAELEGLLELLTTRPAKGWPAHPIFGRMSHAAWLRWGYLHADHHLRQFGA